MGFVQNVEKRLLMVMPTTHAVILQGLVIYVVGGRVMGVVKKVQYYLV
jgi:hypothetical protein